MAPSDVALAVVVGGIGAASTVSDQFGVELDGATWGPRISVAAALMLVRSRLPVVCLAGLFLAFPAWQTLASSSWPSYQIVALFGAAYALAADLPRRRALAAGVVAAGVWGVVAHLVSDDAGPLVGVANVFPPAIFFVLGLAVRRQHDQTVQIAALARRLDEQQDLVARAAVIDERASIARELHDAVAHTVSVMVLRAGAVRGLLTPDQVREQEILQDVERSGRAAVGELHRMLGMLRDESAVELSPTPGLARLDDLVAGARDAGVPVEVEVHGEPVPLPSGLDVSAYRIVQEALNNVMRHAASSPTSVRLTYRPDRLVIDVDDSGRSEAGPPPAPGSGLGLTGMRERVALYGGTLDVGPTPRGGFAVRASLPLRAGAP